VNSQQLYERFKDLLGSNANSVGTLMSTKAIGAKTAAKVRPLHDAHSAPKRSSNLNLIYFDSRR
jgi:hypothetical protein